MPNHHNPLFYNPVHVDSFTQSRQNKIVRYVYKPAISLLPSHHHKPSYITLTHISKHNSHGIYPHINIPKQDYPTHQDVFPTNHCRMRLYTYPPKPHHHQQLAHPPVTKPLHRHHRLLPNLHRVHHPHNSQHNLRSLVPPPMPGRLVLQPEHLLLRRQRAHDVSNVSHRACERRSKAAGGRRGGVGGRVGCLSR